MSSPTKGAYNLTRKLTTQSGVEKPLLPGQCWALKRSYGGSLFYQFVNCAKNVRKGHLTCSYHADREQAAQELKALIGT